MIPVVVCFQLRTSFLITHARSCGQFVNILFKIGINFFLTDTADFGILVNHGNVTQVIQITEHAALPNLVTPVSRAKRMHPSMDFNAP